MKNIPSDIITHTLHQYGQQHLLNHAHSLPGNLKTQFLNTLGSIDFELVHTLSTNFLKEDNALVDFAALSPLNSQSVSSLSSAQTRELTQLGVSQISRGKVAVLLVAGGQGTRLGFDGPKGAYDIGLKSGRSLFELQAQRLKYISSKFNALLPWYIMTSPANHKDTLTFFESHNYFGLKKNSIKFFTQGTMPAVDSKGKILISSPGQPAMSPNGNGGVFKALSDSGSLEDMALRGVEWLFFYTVDNALVKIADPLFIGHTLASGHPVGSKVLDKLSPEEKLGVLCMYNGRPAVIEYSDMPEYLLNEYTQDNELKYKTGNIAIHLFNRKFLEDQAHTPLPFHKALKKIPYLNTNGEIVKPEVPNAYKFEMFMFDIFPQASGMSSLSVIRQEEFAPVKNKTGDDSAQSARKLLEEHYQKTKWGCLI